MIQSSATQEDSNTTKQNSVSNAVITDFTTQDFSVTTNLRPNKIDDYIGQSKLIKQLHLILRSAKLRETIPEHILLYGPPGLGKTTLANIIAEELSIDIRIVSAPALQKVGDLMNILINLDKPTIVFVDEIHRLRSQVEETLYSAMEDRKVDLVMGKGTGVNTIRIDLSPFILVGATTKFGNISKPLRDRFPNIFKLEPYSDDEMRQLINRNTQLLGVSLTADAVAELCLRSRGVPRVANNILKRFLDLKTVHHTDNSTIDAKQAKAFLSEMGIFEDGFTAMDLNYLQALKNGSVSLKTLSGLLQEETQTLEEVIEPYLIQKGLIDKDSSGRRLTLKGMNYIGITQAGTLL
jgi:holliday junction DNA helicase RuvB